MLSFFTPIAYDYRFALEAIAAYAPIADEIILGLDADRLTWMRQPFEIDLDALDIGLRLVALGVPIRLIEANFHRYDDPKWNEQEERLACTSQIRAGNWIVSIDSDELLLSGAAFRGWLLEQAPDVNVTGKYLTVFKAFGDDLLVVDPAETMPMASKSPSMTRYTGQPVVEAPLFGLHLSWGRTPTEVYQKLTNWGHAKDFDTEAYFRFWDSVTLDNASEIKDFHPICPPLWGSLKQMRFTSRRIAGP